jgi:hypothetical protein
VPWDEGLADRKIRDAMDAGHFRNLPGKGQPLRLDEDTSSPPDQRLANRILKNANLTPDWIGRERELDGMRAECVRLLARYEDRRRRSEEALRGLGASQYFSRREAIDAERDRFLGRYAVALAELNARILAYNLLTPTVARQRHGINVVAEMLGLEGRFPLLATTVHRASPPWRAALEEWQRERQRERAASARALLAARMSR